MIVAAAERAAARSRRATVLRLGPLRLHTPLAGHPAQKGRRPPGSEWASVSSMRLLRGLVPPVKIAAGLRAMLVIESFALVSCRGGRRNISNPVPACVVSNRDSQFRQMRA